MDCVQSFRMHVPVALNSVRAGSDAGNVQHSAMEPHVGVML